MRLRWSCAALLLAAALAACGTTDRDARQVAGEWRAPNGDLSNSRQARSSIDAASVARLRVAWRVPFVGQYATTPVVVDGVVYTEDMQSNVFAIDLHSGRLKWRHGFAWNGAGPNGVNVAAGRVFGTTPSGVFALKAATGRLLWMRELTRSPAEFVVMTPGLKDERVYVSTNPLTAGGVGTLYAMEAATGKRVWKWEEVPATLWGHPEQNGGGGMWHTPAFDERGGLYIGTANPIPFPGLPEAPWGSSRPGPNKWSNSIVKLDARTGRFLWGRQPLPHDVYDWDLECPIILAHVGGRHVALASGKMGIVYAFDADTGEPLWKRPVGRHNGHDNDNLLAMHRDFGRLEVNRKLYPGAWGGVETPMASDGTTVYVPVNDLYAIYRSQEFEEPERQEPEDGTGEFVAIDIATGRVRWDRRLAHGIYGGATVSNDLAFTTTYEGGLWAMSTDTGKVVWHTQLPAGTDAPVAIAGDTLITAASLPLRRGERPSIIAYRLDAG